MDLMCEIEANQEQFQLNVRDKTKSISSDKYEHRFIPSEINKQKISKLRNCLWVSRRGRQDVKLIFVCFACRLFSIPVVVEALESCSVFLGSVCIWFYVASAFFSLQQNFHLLFP